MQRWQRFCVGSDSGAITEDDNRWWIMEYFGEKELAPECVQVANFSREHVPAPSKDVAFARIGQIRQSNSSSTWMQEIHPFPSTAGISFKGMVRERPALQRSSRTGRVAQIVSRFAPIANDRRAEMRGAAFRRLYGYGWIREQGGERRFHSGVGDSRPNSA